VREGEQGDNIYFINSGRVQVSIRTDRKEEELVTTLEDGAIFGEVALLTNLKRTATVQATEHTSCAFLEKETVYQIQEHFPHIAAQLKEKIKDYSDKKMEFRRQMLKNLHYLRNLDPEIINELLCCLEVKRFAKGSTILKSGDVTNWLSFVR